MEEEGTIVPGVFFPPPIKNESVGFPGESQI